MTAVINEETINETCWDMATFTLAYVADDIADFVRDLAKANKSLPEQFDVNSDGWYEAQTRIDEACAALNITALDEACSEYKARAARFLNGWRVKLEMPTK